MRRSDLRGEATTLIAKPASALLYDTAVWYLVWVCGHMWVCVLRSDERCDEFKKQR